MHKTAGTSGSVDRLLQVQTAGRIFGHEMLDIPDELTPVTRLDQGTVVACWWRQRLPAIARDTAAVVGLISGKRSP